jgi:phosphoribosyl-AMP cyclohydrolase
MTGKITNLDDLKFNADGLIPAIVQSSSSKKVLMLAWMSKDSLRLSLETKETVFFSRSRQELWHKGATSGNTQLLQSIEVDCDSDALLVTVVENGPACHTGLESCFKSGNLYEQTVNNG